MDAYSGVGLGDYSGVGLGDYSGVGLRDTASLRGDTRPDKAQTQFPTAPPGGRKMTNDERRWMMKMKR